MNSTHLDVKHLHARVEELVRGFLDELALLKTKPFDPRPVFLLSLIRLQSELTRVDKWMSEQVDREIFRTVVTREKEWVTKAVETSFLPEAVGRLNDYLSFYDQIILHDQQKNKKMRLELSVLGQAFLGTFTKEHAIAEGLAWLQEFSSLDMTHCEQFLHGISKTEKRFKTYFPYFFAMADLLEEWRDDLLAQDISEDDKKKLWWFFVRPEPPESLLQRQREILDAFLPLNEEDPVLVPKKVRTPLPKYLADALQAELGKGLQKESFDLAAYFSDRATWEKTWADLPVERITPSNTRQVTRLVMPADYPVPHPPTGYPEYIAIMQAARPEVRAAEHREKIVLGKVLLVAGDTPQKMLLVDIQITHEDFRDGNWTMSGHLLSSIRISAGARWYLDWLSSDGTVTLPFSSLIDQDPGIFTAIFHFTKKPKGEFRLLVVDEKHTDEI